MNKHQSLLQSPGRSISVRRSSEIVLERNIAKRSSRSVFADLKATKENEDEEAGEDDNEKGKQPIRPTSNGPLLALSSDAATPHSSYFDKVNDREQLLNMRQQRNFGVMLNGVIIGEYRRTQDTQEYLVQYLLTQKAHLKSETMTPESIQALKQRCQRILARSHRMLANSRFDRQQLLQVKDNVIINNALEQVLNGLQIGEQPQRSKSATPSGIGRLSPIKPGPGSSPFDSTVASPNGKQNLRQILHTSLGIRSSVPQSRGSNGASNIPLPRSVNASNIPKSPSPTKSLISTMKSPAKTPTSASARMPLLKPLLRNSSNANTFFSNASKMPAPANVGTPMTAITTDSSFFNAENPAVCITRHLEEASNASQLVQDLTIETVPIQDDRNAETKNMLHKIVKNAENRGGINSSTAIPTKKTTKFPASELRDAHDRLARVKIGESYISELRNLPSIEEMFPIITLKKRSRMFNNLSDESLHNFEQSFFSSIPEHSSFTALREAIDSSDQSIHRSKDREIFSPAEQEARINQLEKNIRGTLVETAHDLDKWMITFDKQTSTVTNQPCMVSNNLPHSNSTQALKELKESEEEDSTTQANKSAEDGVSAYLRKRLPHKLYDKISKETPLSFLKAKRWRPRFVKTQLNMQQHLLGLLDSRDRDRSIIYKSKEHLAMVVNKAMKDAHYVWEVYRGVQPPKRDPNDLKDDIHNTLQSQLDMQARALERDMHLLEENVWKGARKKLEERNEGFFECLLFYRKLLIFLDYLSAPSTKALLHFLLHLRQDLIKHGGMNKQIFFDALIESRAWEAQQPTGLHSEHGILENRESLKLLHYLIKDLKIDSREFFEFFKKNNWKISNELAEMKNKWQSKEQQPK